MDEDLRNFEHGLEAAELLQQLDEKRSVLLQHDSLKLHHKHQKRA